MIEKNIKAIIVILFLLSPNCIYGAQEFFEPKTRKEIPYKLLEIEVQKGDTLHSFAKRYLNDPTRWPELLQYNKIPSGDPNLIIPGEVVKVPTELVKDEIADIFYMKNNVRIRRKEANLWKAAELYQRLFPEDGIRTAEKSFSKIKYLKGGRASIGENSLVFLRPEKKRDDVVRLEVGEITAKDVKVLTATASIDPEKGSEYTATVDKAQTTKLSVLKGKVDFISSGEVVTVLEGFMSVAEFDKPPTKPTKLPDAPEFKKIDKIEGVDKKVDIVNENIMKKNVLDSEYIINQINVGKSESKSSRDLKGDRLGMARIKEIHIQVAQDIEFSRIAIDKIVDKARPKLWKEKLEDGKYWWRAAFINVYDVQGEYSDPVVLEVDSRPQKLEITSPLDGDKVEKSIVTVKGITEKDTAVKVNNNSAVIYDDGSFVSAVKLKPGFNDINVVAKKFDGRVVEKKIRVNCIVKVKKSNKGTDVKGKLTLKITTPSDGEKIYKRIVTIRGKTARGAYVLVNNNQAVVEDDGNFVTAIGLKAGSNEITVKAMDKRNNIEIREITVLGMIENTVYEKEGIDTPPVIEIISPQNGDKIGKRIVMIRGRIGPETTVIVNNSRAIVEDDGTFVSAVYLKPGPNKISIKATDTKGRIAREEINVIAIYK